MKKKLYLVTRTKQVAYYEDAYVNAYSLEEAISIASKNENLYEPSEDFNYSSLKNSVWSNVASEEVGDFDENWGLEGLGLDTSL